MFDDIQPTLERLRKDEEFSQPIIDNKTNRRAWRRLDTFQILLRDNKIQQSHHDAGERFLRHWIGRMRYDARVTDYFTVSNSQVDGMPPWQWHGSCLADAKSALLPDEFSCMELIAKHETQPDINFTNPIIFIGCSYGGYKSRKEGMGYGLRLVVSSLERLAYLWGLKTKGSNND